MVVRKIIAGLAVAILVSAALTEFCLAHYGIAHAAWPLYLMMGAALAGTVGLRFVTTERALTIGLATGCILVAGAFALFMAGTSRW